MTRRALATVAAAALGLALALASTPWVFVAIGAAMLGDDARADRVIDSSPLARYFAWREAHRV